MYINSANENSRLVPIIISKYKYMQDSMMQKYHSDIKDRNPFQLKSAIQFGESYWDVNVRKLYMFGSEKNRFF